jgi:endonuclease I
MKKFTLLFVLLITSISFGQIPNGYYNSATGTGYTLKTQLYNIIKNHNTQSYGNLWNLYTNNAFRDHYYENDNSLLDVYSEIPTGQDQYEYTSTSQQCGSYSGEGSCYNREHTIPQSSFGSALPMYSDAHFVLPTDGFVNGARGDLPFGKVATATYTSSNGSKKGNNTNSGYSAGYSGTVFEPIDEFKGDIARCLLYYATRYQDVVTSHSFSMFNGTSDQVFTNTFLNILIKWNIDDPVSAYEIAKNNAVYAFQSNRNPYIDHPEFVCQIWSTQCATLSNEYFASIDNKISVYPNPSNDHKINIESAISVVNLQLITINGQLMMEIKNPTLVDNTYSIENIPNGFYFLRVTSENQTVVKKIIVN